MLLFSIKFFEFQCSVSNSMTFYVFQVTVWESPSLGEIRFLEYKMLGGMSVNNTGFHKQILEANGGHHVA